MTFAARVLQRMLRDARADPPPPADESDLRLHVGPAAVVLRAHRSVLAAVSPVFAAWFAQADGEAGGGGGGEAGSGGGGGADAGGGGGGGARRRRTVEIALPDFPVDAVEAALAAVYGGGMGGVDGWEVAANVWDFAVRFRVGELEAAARKRALQLLDVDNALRLLAYALAVADEPAIDHVADYVARPAHFVRVVRSDQFLRAGGPVLDAMATRPGKGALVDGEGGTVEKAWFDAVVRWLRVPAEPPRDAGDPAAAAAAADAERPAAGGGALVAVGGEDADAAAADAADAAAADDAADDADVRPDPRQRRRMRHVDHVLDLVEFTRMTTEELSMCAEDVTACHAARFPNCLIPLLAERAADAERGRAARDAEIADLGAAFRAAVYAKNEAERAATVVRGRLAVVRADAAALRAALDDAAARRQVRSPPRRPPPPPRAPHPPSPPADRRARRGPFLSDDGGGDGDDDEDDEDDDEGLEDAALAVADAGAGATAEPGPAPGSPPPLQPLPLSPPPPQRRRRRRRAAAPAGDQAGDRADDQDDEGRAVDGVGDTAAVAARMHAAAAGPAAVAMAAEARRPRPRTVAAAAAARLPYYDTAVARSPGARGNYWGRPPPVPAEFLLGPSAARGAGRSGSAVARHAGHPGVRPVDPLAQARAAELMQRYPGILRGGVGGGGMGMGGGGRGMGMGGGGMGMGGVSMGNGGMGGGGMGNGGMGGGGRGMGNGGVGMGGVGPGGVGTGAVSAQPLRAAVPRGGGPLSPQRPSPGASAGGGGGGGPRSPQRPSPGAPAGVSPRQPQQPPAASQARRSPGGSPAVRSPAAATSSRSPPPGGGGLPSGASRVPSRARVPPQEARRVSPPPATTVH